MSKKASLHLFFTFAFAAGLFAQAPLNACFKARAAEKEKEAACCPLEEPKVEKQSACCCPLDNEGSSGCDLQNKNEQKTHLLVPSVPSPGEGVAYKNLTSENAVLPIPAAVMAKRYRAKPPPSVSPYLKNQVLLI